MTTIDDRSPPTPRKPRRRRYRGSGALAMCGPGPHPGGPLFQQLCALADRFRDHPDDPVAVKIGGVLSALALHASATDDRDFRYPFGSLVMDLALEEEQARLRAQPPGAPVPYGRFR